MFEHFNRLCDHFPELRLAEQTDKIAGDIVAGDAGKHDPSDSPRKRLAFWGDQGDEPGIAIHHSGREHQVGIFEAGDECICGFIAADDEQVMEAFSRGVREFLNPDFSGNGFRDPQGFDMCFINKVLKKPAVESSELHGSGLAGE